MLKLYVDYVNNFNVSISAHQELLKDKRKGKSFKDWSEAAQKQADSKVDLGALLITPVQRCPRYELLLRVRSSCFSSFGLTPLQDLIKLTPPEHSDYQALVTAREKVQEQNQYINEKKKDYETRMKLIEIQDLIYSPAPLVIVAPSRLHVKDGPVHLPESSGTQAPGMFRHRRGSFSSIQVTFS